ncbi:hypothetical protein [Aquimarina sp. SS2-1]|uniref:hypothetical protein n=1 Tax=Aquimarina besae TaxID=3342247 RepID=UPI00366CCC18
MKVFELDFFDNKKTDLKEFLFLIVLFCGCNSYTQPKLRIEPGILLATESDNLGLLFNTEPHIKISENMLIGLRFGIAINPQKIEIDNSASFFVDDLDDNAIISFLPTFDYYLNDKQYCPYVGIGLGYYIFNNIDVSMNGTSEILEGSVNNQPGFLVRGGLEIGKTRLGLEYNFIPEADIEIQKGQVIGTIDNSYVGLSIGFTIGLKKSNE